MLYFLLLLRKKNPKGGILKQHFLFFGGGGVSKICSLDRALGWQMGSDSSLTPGIRGLNWNDSQGVPGKKAKHLTRHKSFLQADLGLPSTWRLPGSQTSYMVTRNSKGRYSKMPGRNL